MKTTNQTILAIALSTRGLGYAVMEGEALADWGAKTMDKGDKNRQMVEKAKKLITSSVPGLIVLEDTAARKSKRCARTRRLTKRLVALAKENKIEVKLFSKEQIRKAFFEDGKGTKQALAELIVQRFPDLAHKLPSERKAWESEKSAMRIFDAMALALACKSQS